MSTPVPPVVASKPPSEFAKIESDIVLVAGKIKAGFEAAGDDVLKLADFAQKNSAEITALAALAGSGATKVSAVGLQVLQLCVPVVKNADAAAGAKGLNIPLDQAAFAAVKALIADLEKI
jgi:hypothetical protein